MKKNSFEKELERKSQVVEDYEKKVDKLKKEVDSIRTEIIKKEQYYKIFGLMQIPAHLTTHSAKS